MRQLLFPALISSAPLLYAQEKVTFNDHARAVMENKCFSCHNPDKKRGDLDLTSYAGAMAGGAGGSIINAGDPDGSKLILTTTKKGEPFMPPDGAPLTAKEIEVLSKWIQGGVLETASSIAKKSQPKTSIAMSAPATGKPEGPPPMPEHVLLEPVVTTPRTTTITAMAASPWAPLVAISGMKQALVYDTEKKVLVGVYPYPEGYIRSLKFSQNGSLLIAGGGRGGKEGNAVAWEVKTGKRVAQVGKEFDQVMSADISPNHAMIVLGSPSKKVRCFNSTSGELVFEIKKHTEWILATSFSPDGVLLATADRNGGVIVSEAATGGEFYVMDSHKVACNSLAWRPDSNVLASAGEDGKIFLYEMQEGKIIKNWDAHPGGCLSVTFTADGNIVSSGRDGTVRVWDINGAKKSESPKQSEMVTKAAVMPDAKTIVSGDWQGNVKVWHADAFTELGTLSSNPAPIAQRIADSERKAEEATGLLGPADEGLKKAVEASQARDAELAQLKKTLEAELPAARQKLEGELNQLPAQIAEAGKALTEAQGKRQTQADALKKHEESVAKLNDHKKELAAATEARGKLASPEQAAQAAEADKKIENLKGQIDPLEKSTTTAPEGIAAFDQAIKAAQEKVNALNAAKPAREKELAEVKQRQEKQVPEAIAAKEKEVAAAKTAEQVARQHQETTRNQVAYLQKLPNLLRAAQVNVGLLTEKETLEKLEENVKGFQEALKDAEAAKTAAAKRIQDSNKIAVETGAGLPRLDAVLKEQSARLQPLEQSLAPLKKEEAEALAKVEAMKKDLGGKEAEVTRLEQERNARMEATKKASEEMAPQIAALQKPLDELNQKLAEPAKTTSDKHTAMSKAQGVVDAARPKHADADKAAAQATETLKTKDAELAAATQKHQATTDPAQKPDAEKAEVGARAAQEAAKKAADDAGKVAAQLKGELDAAQKAFEQAKAEHDAAAKVSAPLFAQQKDLQGKVDAQKKTQADKQAEAPAMEKEYAGKIQPVKDAIAQVRTALGLAEAALQSAKEKVVAASPPVDAQRDVTAKAKAAYEAAQKAVADAKATAESSLKEITTQTGIITEAKTELAKLEPQLQPLRDKVKQLNEQYLAILSK